MVVGGVHGGGGGGGVGGGGRVAGAVQRDVSAGSTSDRSQRFFGDEDLDAEGRPRGHPRLLGGQGVLVVDAGGVGEGDEAQKEQQLHHGGDQL